jgi:hypothetical protein
MKANLLIHIGRKHGAGWIPAPAMTKDDDVKGCECSGCTRPFSSATAYYYHAIQCFAAPPEMLAKLAGVGLNEGVATPA